MLKCLGHSVGPLSLAQALLMLVTYCVIVTTPPHTQLCSELATKLNETASQPLQETATKKKIVFKKVTVVI